MKRRAAIVLVLTSISAFNAKAYDFALRLNYGDSLYFDIVDASRGHVMVVAPNGNVMGNYQDYAKPSGVLRVPTTVTYENQRYTVTAIGARAFANCQDLTAVILPQTVTAIEDYAFYNCTGLKGTVTIGEGVRSVGSSAYYGCTSINEVIFRATRCVSMGSSMSTTVFGNCTSLTSVSIADNVERVPDYAFCGADALAEVPQLPQSVTYVGSYAFAYCSNMQGKVDLPDGVDTVGEGAYLHCHNITGATIGRAVRHIGHRAFGNCMALANVVVRAYRPPMVGAGAFELVSNKAVFSVPCVSSKLYKADRNWKDLNLSSVDKCRFSVDARSTVPHACIFTGTGQYAYGDSVEVAVICAAGYGFDGWDDGQTANPRRFVADNDYSLTAVVRPSGTITLRDTVVHTDTVFADGIKVVHDTVELNDVARPIAAYSNMDYNPASKRVQWVLRKGEKATSVAVYNGQGDCVYTSSGRRNHVDMSRYPTGSYIVRIETDERVLRARFFVSSSSNYGTKSEPKPKRKKNK